MKITKIEHRILQALLKKREGIGAIEISRKIGIDRFYAHRKLQKMHMHGILERIPSIPVIYRINLKQKGQLCFMEVICPKCGWEYRVHYLQLTKLCQNPECVRPNGTQTRFNINKPRIVKIDMMI